MYKRQEYEEGLAEYEDGKKELDEAKQKLDEASTTLAVSHYQLTTAQNQLQQLLEAGETYDLVIAIGPLPMMRAVAGVTKPYGIKTIVSMNPIMIDGTGMCGCLLYTSGNEYGRVQLHHGQRDRDMQILRETDRIRSLGTDGMRARYASGMPLRY